MRILLQINNERSLKSLIDFTVVLGRPDAGCSTLLRVLANQRGEYHGIEGDVFYDSFTPAQSRNTTRAMFNIPQKTTYISLL